MRNIEPEHPAAGRGRSLSRCAITGTGGVQRQCFSTVGKYMTKIKEYIANQMKEDKMTEQMAIMELLGMFKQ